MHFAIINSAALCQTALNLSRGRLKRKEERKRKRRKASLVFSNLHDAFAFNYSSALRTMPVNSYISPDFFLPFHADLAP